GGGAVVRRISAADREERREAGGRARVFRVPARERRDRQPLDARRRVLQGHYRKERGSSARQSRHHRQQERDSLRSESADGRVGHSRRHARGHDARHARKRNGNHRRAVHARAENAGRRSRAGHDSLRSRDLVPEVPTLSGVVESTFAVDGPLARAMPDFEAREGQVEMARAVARVFERGGTLLAEAGTGTGKTLAYLIPAILSRERVLVSTGTKNLQEQIYFKDIPALREALRLSFTATYMKGRANYLCLH